MKSFPLLPLLATGSLAHYYFPNTIVDGVQSDDWEFIRQTQNVPGSEPVEDLDSNLLRCFEASDRPAADVLSVAAGAEIGLKSSNSMGHPGPSLFYMARVPDGEDITTWQPTGDVWFKIDHYGDQGGEYPQFETEMTEIYTTIPSSVPDGNYLLRAEHIGLHVAGAPQFYIACAQLSVSGGGSGNPSPLVSFPGVYTMNDPGLSVNIYVADGPYEYPGPEVWSG
ncbi:cellulose-growth-specific protein [Sodiomyces alkalinus F11]|uniref:lytic cellulose monooxygenase (C4-dehydrogenating) n=1 Tax=Sodiomyces alkalinus (strain CBS 110278 / VKM F-3762 / F11) TaxID=1314773 RepID=A0A3N2PV75_SODAK|nr:cellulose-growth-specific protein [Sodiomyces alkalinus F11]ROT38246.1 cellulose-growth-specific protein [Sodiomyces alkalinus F11]